MNTGEEIRESVITNIAKAWPGILNKDIVKLADKILQDMASQGCVLKAEREWPNEFPEIKLTFGDDSYYVLTEIIGGKYKEAGYVATMPLIEG